MVVDRAADGTRRVLISSTSLDLRAEREALEKALNRVRDAEFRGMEYFGSRPGTPKEVSLLEVDRSDIYVGIFARRYGHVDPETGRSITELEYRRAAAAGKPCLIYLSDEGRPADPASDETLPENVRKLEALKADLRRDHVVTTFSNPDELATKVIIDLHNLIAEGRLPAPVPVLSPADLRIVMTMHFNLNELKNLCFDLGVDYEEFGEAGKSGMVRELIAHMRRRGRFDELVGEIKRTRPDLNL
jgi:hypothetical protein